MKKYLYITLFVLSLGPAKLFAQQSAFSVHIQKSAISGQERWGNRIGASYTLQLFRGYGLEAGMSYLQSQDLDDIGDYVGKNVMVNTVDLRLGLFKSIELKKHRFSLGTGFSYRFRNEVLIKNYAYETFPGWEHEFSFDGLYVIDYEHLEFEDIGGYIRLDYQYALSPSIGTGFITSYQRFDQGFSTFDLGLLLVYKFN